jgi:four helix bundle protein
MLRIYVEFLGVLRGMRPLIEKIERRDSDLARQLRRAAASVALNMSEGSGSEGGTRRQRYLSALGSARETLSCLEVADAFGYAEIAAGGEAVAGLNRVIGGLVRLVGR